MRYASVYKLISTLFIALLLTACGNDDSAKKAAQEGNGDIIARVGDQDITYSQLSTMLNSSAMVGLSVPALGTPERSQVILTLLDKAISANLIYLDAKEKGTDRLVSYTEDVKRFEDAILASMYKSKVMIGDIQVSDVDVLHYYNTETNKEKELTDDVKLAIEAKIRKQKLEEMKSTSRERLRKNVEVVINEDVLSPDYDDKRTDANVVATFDGSPVIWSDVKDLMKGADQRSELAAFYIDSDEERRLRLEQYIDNAIMTKKGREFGLEKDPDYIKRIAEYKKARLINEHRRALIHSWNPSVDDLKTYYVDHMDKIVVPEKRKVQMVVVKTKEEAESIKAKIDAGEITMYQAAQQYSLDPNAKRTLGDMGWVSQGTGFEDLDEFTFNLEPEVLSGPVESPAGWHLVKVLDVTDAQYENFDDPQTQVRTLRAYMQDKFSDYVVDLRKNHFEVAVYDDVLNQQFQKEADYIAELGKKAEEKGSVTEQRVEELHQWMVKPAPE